MRIKLLSFLVSFLFVFGQRVYADTFWITSNADSGPGTLREAIMLANSNGTTIFDTILFNIPDISKAGRTITLQTELPTLTSKIIIDGSSQPGPVFGLSTAKVILYLAHYAAASFNFLFIENASSVKIFGLCFDFFANPDAAGGLNYGILLINSTDITIGAPNKGNLFSAIRMSITNLHWNSTNNLLRDITIQSNVFGLGPENQLSLRGNIHLFTSGNITIGGESANEGNLFVGAQVYVSQTETKTTFFAKVQNNRFNVSWDGTQYFHESGSIALWGNLTDEILPAKTFVTNNIMSSAGSGGISLAQLNHKAIVQGNILGTDITGTICTGFNNDIGIQLSKDIVIGGYLPEEENIIAGNIYTQHHGVHIIKNKLGGDIWNYGTPPNDPFIKILTYDAGLITGVANPNAKIQLYIRTSCDEGCIKKKYLTTVYADPTGNWSFPYTTGMLNIVATSTMSDSSTSSFSIPNVNHNNPVITHATCGKSNGSITGIKVYEGTHIRWYNSNTMQLISTDTNLVNAPAGSYVLTVTNGENGCPWSANFVINDIQPPPFLNPEPYIIDASCGQNNGSITTYSFEYGSKWMNANYDSVGTGYYINNALPGTYYLKLWINYDTSCNKTYGPFIIKNNSGPTLNINNVQITSSTCSNSNGSIKNISVSNVTGTPFIQWLDSLNNPVSSALNLVNVKAGKYLLKFKDQGACDTIITPYYVIPATGAISIDARGKVVTSGGCTVNNGSIRNIKIAGADTWQWQNLTTNTTAGNNIDIFSLTSGDYQLTASNIFGCTLSSPVITVPQSQFISIIPQYAAFDNGYCGDNNGFLKLEGFSNEEALLSYYWINTGNNEVVGTDLTMTGLSAGTYEFVAIDTNGCQQTIFRQPIIINPKPDFNISGMRLTDDRCSLQKGSITGIKINGLQGPATYTWTNANNLVVGNSPDLSNIGAGNYRLIVKDKDVCIIESDLFTLQNNDNAGISPGYDDIIIQRNTSANLLIKNFQPGNYILYDDIGGTQILQQNTTGIFTTPILNADKDFYVRHIAGSCRSPLVRIKVTVVDKSMFTIPTGFTPNNDGVNDKLTLKVIGYIEVEYFRIYNRNGELIFTTNAINNGWDGNLKGTKQPSGVYVWMAKGKDINGKTITDKGSFVLIR